MKVGVVRMLVADRDVTIPVGVQVAYWVPRRVHVLMMLVVNVAVLMVHRLVVMVMTFRLVQVDADRHQDRRAYQPHGDGFANQDQRQSRAQERGSLSRRLVGRAPKSSGVARILGAPLDIDARVDLVPIAIAVLAVGVGDAPAGQRIKE